MDRRNLVVGTLGASLVTLSIAGLAKKYNCPHANIFYDLSFVSIGIAGLLSINWASDHKLTNT